MTDTNTLGKPLSAVDCLSTGKRLKANVYKAKYGDQQIVIKDFSTTPFYLKPLVKILAKREVCALQRLQGSAHVPRLIKVIDPYRFAMEYIEGVHPTQQQDQQLAEVYTMAWKFLIVMHGVGVTHNDLRRKNMILHPQRGLVFIDFGAAVIWPYCTIENKRWWLMPACWLKEKLQKADIYHLIRLKHGQCSEPLNCSELKVLRTGRPFRRTTRIWKFLFRGKRHYFSYCNLANALRQAFLARFALPKKLVSGQNARQKHG